MSGFLIDMAPEQTAMLWTTNGFAGSGCGGKFQLKDKLVDCQFRSLLQKPYEKGETHFLKGCVMGPNLFRRF